MRSISVRPSATSPANTKDAEARRSVAITGAACSFSTPLMIAADTVSDRVECSKLRLHVGGKRGIWSGADIDRLRPTAAHVDFDRVAADTECRARVAQFCEHRIEMFGACVAQHHVTARDRTGEQIGARFDTIGQHVVLRPVQLLNTVDDDGVGARTAHLRTHRVQKIREVDDFGFARRIFKHRLTVSERRSHHQIFGARHRHSFEHQSRTAQSRSTRPDVAVLDRNVSAHRLQTGDVDVDRTRTDRAATGQRNIGMAEARDQGPEYEDRGAHGAHEFIGCDRLPQRRCIDLDAHALVDRNRDAHATEQFDHGRDVLQVGHVADRHRFRGQQSRCEDRQRRILCTRDAHLALERCAALDLQPIHQRAPPPASSGVKASIDSA